MPVTSKFATELLALYKPLAAWEDRLFQSDLVNRAVDMDQSLPGTAKASLAQTAAYFEYACEIKAFVKECAQRVGIDPNATILVEGEKLDLYDWTCLDYTGFEALVAQTKAALAIQVPDLKAVIPSWVAAMGPDDLARTAISKLLAALGVSEFYDAFLRVLEEGWGHILRELGEAITSRDWRRVRVLLKKLLDIIISAAFFERLAARIGAAAAARVVGKILAKFIPFVGWIWLIGSIIWAFAEEFI